ncbi:virulence protein SciE type [Halovibrio salipaludis]|uniref:Virulence protein SciE type n=1 Tax=Halovibrio salipaludis TaxID=2032626 RepID=A0A2A2F9N2_9GAMM|nr:type VI secretion system accessory protein TagJ [Halovibrio salipaludis]PAU82146.1 virulence protein SciE type [Halovibrio salipaludis]
MEPIRQYLSAGELTPAIEVIQDHLREAPSASDWRACLVELLCIANDLQRADQVLEHLARHHPDWLAGAANLRQLLRAQQARLALREGQLADGVVATPGASLEALLKLHAGIGSGDMEAAGEAARALEETRSTACFQRGDQAGPVRDCDDTLNGYLEALGTDGHFYLWQWDELESIHFEAPASPLEWVWRRARVALSSGSHGEVLLPLTYATSETDAQKLGRETDWVERAPGVVTGVGLKLLLLGDEAVPLDGRLELERQTRAGADHETV